MTSYYDLLIYSVPTIENNYPHVFKTWSDAFEKDDRTSSRTLNMLLKSLEYHAKTKAVDPADLLDQLILENIVEQQLFNQPLLRLIQAEESKLEKLNQSKIPQSTSPSPKETEIMEKHEQISLSLGENLEREAEDGEEALQLPGNITFHKIRKALSRVDKGATLNGESDTYLLSEEFEESEPITSLVYSPSVPVESDDKAAQIHQITTFLKSAVNQLDDKTGDIFTLMVYRWIVKPDKSNVVTLSFTDVMEACGYGIEKSYDGKVIHRREYVQEITSRMAALMGVSYIAEHRQETVHTGEDGETEATLRMLKRLFLWEGVTELRHSRTDELLGIQEFSFMPSPLFAETLEHMKQELMLLDPKILEYKDRERYIKRLGYFLEQQWAHRYQYNIPQNEPFSLFDIIHDVQYPINRKSKATVKKAVEKWFQTLYADGILSEPFTYAYLSGEKGINGYLESTVLLIPPNRKARKMVSIHQRSKEKQEKGDEVTPRMVKEVCNERGISIRKLAKVVGVSESTVRRFVNGNGPKKPNKKLMGKLKDWIYSSVE